MHSCIRNVPAYIEEQIEREAKIARDLLWEVKPLNKRNANECKESSDQFVKMLRSNFVPPTPLCSLTLNEDLVRVKKPETEFLIPSILPLKLSLLVDAETSFCELSLK